ncbi:MAG: AsmA-like C-terminal region-containing protein [Flavobacteriales bacterium]
MKLIKKITLISLSVILALLLVGVVMVKVFEDDIKAYALEQIGSQLSTDINVKAVSLTLWDQFPSASLQFDNVLIHETFEASDTLIFAEHIFLNFSVADFISGIYEVEEIAIDQAEINLKRKSSGEDNYHFWKESDGDAAEFKIDLSKVKLENTQVNFDDKLSGLDLSVMATTSDISGSITQEILDLNGSIDTHVQRLNVSGQSYIQDKTLAGNAGLTIDLSEDLYTFSPSLVAVNDLPLNISGSVDLEEASTILDLKAESSKADLSAVIRNLPLFVREKLSAFSSNGDFNTSIALTGAVSSGVMPNIEARFSLTDGQLTNKASGVTLDDICTSGSYVAKSGQEDLLLVNDIKCALGSGTMAGSGKISRLTNPFINSSLQGKFDLEELLGFVKLPEIEELRGLANVNLNYKGNFGKNWNPTASNIRHAAVSGDVKIENASIKLYDTPHLITEISCSAALSENDAEVTALHAELGASDFNFDGSFKNLIPYLCIKNEKLKVTANLKSEFIDLNTLLAGSSEDENPYLLNFPDHFEFDLNTDIATLNFRQFNAASITAQTKLNKKRLQIDPLKMNTAEGSFSSKIYAEQVIGGDFKVSSTGDLAGVNISSLFQQFENFHQEFITNQHLKGTAKSDFTFSAVMSNTMDIKSETVKAQAHITLKNGELIQHESLAEMASYMKDKKLMSALTDMEKFSDKLAHVKFSELSNTIIIKNSQITIPKMEIKSDALDIYAQGSHGFDNSIDYSIGFDIADLAARKDFAEDEKGLSKHIFVSMKGTSSEPEFGYDQLAVKEQRKENRAKEKKKIKQLLKDEFSKKEETAAVKDTKKAGVQVSWDDSKKPTEPPKPTIDKRTDKPKPKISIEPSSDIDEDDDF